MSHFSNTTKINKYIRKRLDFFFFFLIYTSQPSGSTIFDNVSPEIHSTNGREKKKKMNKNK